MKYKITIKELEPYKVLETKYEAEDGKRYSSMYSIPEGVKYKDVKLETGEFRYSEREVFNQEQEMFSILDVIKAVNGLFK